MTRWMTVVLIFLLPSISEARSLRFSAFDESGAPFPNVLIIVSSLDTNQEKGRYLTDAKGETPELQVGTDLYQVIATCPYGICKTLVREFFATSSPDVIHLRVPMRSTDEIGTLVNAKTATLVFHAPKAGRGTNAGVYILARDDKAIRQVWYRTDQEGKVTVQIFSDPLSFVVKYASKVYRYVLLDQCTRSWAIDAEADCVTMTNGIIQLKAPAAE